MLRPQSRWPIFFCALLLAPASLRAQDNASELEILPQDGNRQTEDEGLHVVRPGETLRSLAKRYLGDDAQWQDLQKLNPSIRNPDLIFTGTRLRVPLPEKRLPRHNAMVTRTAGRVENQLRPQPWENAQRRNILVPDDALRTFEQGSSELLFSDATRLVVSELSTIYVRESDRAEEVDRELIEVEIGQADLDYDGGAENAPDVEIVLGESSARPRLGDGGKIQTRARLDDSKQAQLMVYDGASELAAGGSAVTVEKGMGAIVEAGEPPSPPERLLPAPAAIDPPSDSRWPINRPLFRWEAVDGAESYTLEVCRDPRCGELVARTVELGETSWRPDDSRGLPVERLYWRVTAVSPSGLDGYQSEPLPFAIEGEGSDESPPWALVRFDGPQISIFGRLIVGVGTTIEIEHGDEETGIAEWTPYFDGREVAPDVLRGPWPPGEHTVGAVIVDRAGNRLELEPVAFAYDPDPPVIEWGFQNEGPAATYHGVDEGVPPDEYRISPRWRERARRGELRTLLWSRAGEDWIPIEARQDSIRSTAPEIWIRAEKKPVTFGGGTLALTRDRHLWIRAADAISRGCNLSVQVVNRPEGPMLVVRSVDLLANKTEFAWPLMTRPAK